FRSPAARPAVPTVGHLLHPAGGGVHACDRPGRRPRRALQHRAACARSHPQRPRVPAHQRDPRRAADAHGTGAEGDPRGVGGDPGAVLPDARRAELDRRDLMKRLRIEHATGFSYQGDVGASYNEARMLPSSTGSQFVLSSQLDIAPSTSVNHYVDYFGTRVAAFDVLAPHSALDITARSLVEVRPRPLETNDMTWEQLQREAD